MFRQMSLKSSIAKKMENLVVLLYIWQQGMVIYRLYNFVLNMVPLWTSQHWMDGHHFSEQPVKDFWMLYNFYLKVEQILINTI